MRQFALLLFAALLAATGLRAEDAKPSDTEAEVKTKADDEFDKGKYQEIERGVLLAAPEEFKNKRVAFKAMFAGFATKFPPYMEASGVKQTKYFWLKAGLKELPLFLPKDKGSTELAGTLQQGANLAVYGKVKKFKRKPKNPGLPLYYLEAEHLEPVVATDKTEAGDKTDDKDKESEADLDDDIQDMQSQLLGGGGAKKDNKRDDNPLAAPESDAGAKSPDAKAGGKKGLWFE